ncbi:ammecr1 family protein [Trifolium pratense]|uniref:Ammecr1 family protein n=1 Tax=Trifolium pratense TaxID=57577 RepID=A0A2K3NW68_TRIPR|nr:ammecr1 family protein [Trifolium pratense]
MVTANKEMVVYCFDTLVAHYNGDQPPPPSFEDGHHPLFVTWKKVVNGGEPRLRGCIGSLEARGLINGFRDYALTSALRDRRFPPIEARELPLLECTVSILTDYETANDYLDWEVGKHGIIIEFSDPDYNTRRSATYLPEVASHEEKSRDTREVHSLRVCAREASDIEVARDTGTEIQKEETKSRETERCGRGKKLNESQQGRDSVTILRGKLGHV